MRFATFIGTQGASAPEAIAEMNAAWPAYEQELARRGGFRLGRELNLPEDDAATVRVREGEPLVSDGPFAETKEFVAGLELFDSADLDEAVERTAANPVARFHPFELRPLPESFNVSADVDRFADGDDSTGTPYLLSVWVEASTTLSSLDTAAARACDDWRTRLTRDGSFILGGDLGSRAQARTMRLADGRVQLSDGPIADLPQYIAGIEVIRAPDRARALELAAEHPFAREHAIELRSFYVDGA